MWGMTRYTKQVLSNVWMTCQSILPCFAQRRGMSYNGGASTHIWEVKYAQFIPQLAKPLLIKWFGEDIDKLIIGGHTLNTNVPLLQYLWEYSSPLCHQWPQKVSSNFREVVWNHYMWGLFSQIWSNLDYLPKKFNSVWSKDKLLHTSK